ncbi:membrane-bound lytic murein transglycosylase MltF [Shewanella dokdonensis]|uniref:Membrane-bound lytic murein transglycosylase F n=1 Tax=Shewanella dokdonensis TaxID=712036 RepID=A0ABX8DDJ2_9GAMM|nr:membrane-bound lytic murein transglycosylase MltF [Shewanella dokdonensis]QVK22789.1 membrane-bound lytic murein transglycosylase MltF [Shewanella dokdonensis]
MKKLTAVFTALLLLAGCQKLPMTETPPPTPPGQFETLRVGTLYGPQIYVASARGDSGFDYELASRFADFLNKPLEMVPYGSIHELYHALDEGQIDLIAAGLGDTDIRRNHFRLSPPLYHVNQLLVYREGNAIPTDLSSLSEPLEVVADSSFIETLEDLKPEYPSLQWQEVNDKDNEELLSMIASGELQYTITDSTSLEINRRFMPELRASLVLKQQQPVVWLLPRNNSDPLMSELLRFWHQEKRDGTLDHLVEKYFGHVKRFDYVDTRAFIRAVKLRLPQFESWFKSYAGELDWRKLAATSYQESHWNPRARSPTGVRGMMMLTIPTAQQLGVDDRLDPQQSIRGGAEYLASILQTLPASIPDEERMWFALASYNVGFGHVEDARVLAEKLGKNPSAWKDVKQVLPLLQKRKYYQETKYGYARGSEAVQYVDNIRRYYDTLVWLDNQHDQQTLADNNSSDVPDAATEANDISGAEAEAVQPR